MKRMITFLVVSCLVISAAVADEKNDIVKTGKAFESPNGKILATLIDEEGKMEFLNKATGNIFETSILMPLFSAGWTGDSETFVTIEHLAGGSQATMFHLQESGWRRFDIDPPVKEESSYAVVNVKFGSNSIKITYKVIEHNIRNNEVKFYLINFDVNPVTGEFSNVDQRKINVDTYKELGLKLQEGKEAVGSRLDK